MAKLLYIEASPRKERSASIAVANAFIEQYRATHPEDEIEVVDLWKVKLPEFSDDVLNAKYRILHGQEHTPQEAAAWKAVVELVDAFKSADKYLFSLPMWNFGIPYKLKHYIDVLTQPGLTFAFDPATGYSGLVTGKPVTVIYARGGEYGHSSAIDHQKSYMDLFLGFIGFEDVRTILVEPTLMTGDLGALVQKASESAKDAASKF